MQREWLLYCIVEQQNEELREEQYYYLCKRKSKRKLALFRIIFYRGKVVKERESKRSSISQGKFETQLKPRKSLFSDDNEIKSSHKFMGKSLPCDYSDNYSFKNEVIYYRYLSIKF